MFVKPYANQFNISSSILDFYVRTCSIEATMTITKVKTVDKKTVAAVCSSGDYSA